jgi:hypothetical protein
MFNYLRKAFSCAFIIVLFVGYFILDGGELSNDHWFHFGVTLQFCGWVFKVPNMIAKYDWKEPAQQIEAAIPYIVCDILAGTAFLLSQIQSIESLGLYRVFFDPFNFKCDFPTLYCWHVRYTLFTIGYLFLCNRLKKDRNYLGLANA